MVINTYGGNYRCGNTSSAGCSRRAAVKADRVEAMVMDAVRKYTADARGRASAAERSRAADAKYESAQTALDRTIRQLGDLGLLGEPSSREALEKLTTARDEAREEALRLSDGRERKVISPDDIDRLRDPKKRLAEWRGLIADTVESVTVAPAGSTVWDDSRIAIKFLGQ